MEPLVATIEIARSPEKVFAFATDPLRFAEWQHDVISVSMLGDSQFTTTRRIGGAERTIIQQITRNDPPRAWAAQGIDRGTRSRSAAPACFISDIRHRALPVLLAALAKHYRPGATARLADLVSFRRRAACGCQAASATPTSYQAAGEPWPHDRAVDARQAGRLDPTGCAEAERCLAPHPRHGLDRHRQVDTACPDGAQRCCGRARSCCHRPQRRSRR
jgi:Polyketide cyclase / dehydrase and lipid transport